MDSFKNYYSILNVPETASHDEIKTAFRRMARLYAPDVNPDPSVVRHFEDVLEAWGVLSDPAARRAYDQGRGVWNRADADNVFATIPVGRAEPARPDPAPPAPPPPEQAGVFGHGPRRQAPHVRERNAEVEEYFERTGVSLLVLGSLLLLGLTGWPRLESLTDGRGVLKVFLLGLIWGSLFWLSFWGVRFRSPIGGGNGFFLGVLYPCLWGAGYAFLARWFLEDVRGASQPFVTDFALWALSFAVPFALFAAFLEPEGGGPFRLFRGADRPSEW